MKTLKEITGDSLEQMIDYKVVDQDGDSVGTLHSLWSDPTTGAVEFLGVKTGWLFGQNHVVPAEKAELDESQNIVRLPYTSLFVKEAPTMSADAEISEEEEEKIYHYYGLDTATTVATGGQPVISDTNHDKLPEATGASARASASGLDEGGSNFSTPTSGAGSDAAGISRLRRTVRTEPSGTANDPTFAEGTMGRAPTVGEAVHSALDDLTPGDSSSSTTTLSSMSRPGSYGTANLYGSTGTTTPVSADSAGLMSDELTTASGATVADSGNKTPAEHDSNPDPVTGEPGSHPVGTGAGALAGGEHVR